MLVILWWVTSALARDSQLLFETADYRIRTVTQVLENIAFRSDISSDTVVLADFCKLLTTSLRDGCDVMDVIGRRLRAQAAG
ncbi:hypothetical protein CGA22_16980 [Pseudomonas sp. PSB18]|nr:hypothetical protein [Pseudomonas sp. PSB18]